MEQRYKSIYTCTKPYYSVGSLAIIDGVALLYDNNTKNNVTLCKIRNISNKKISSITISVQALDEGNRPLGERVIFSYDGLSVCTGEQIGGKIPIPLSVDNAEKCIARITKIVCDDQTTWQPSEDAKWGFLPSPTPIKTAIPDYYERIGYIATFGKKSQFAYRKTNYLKFCACGAINGIENQSCYNCQIDFSSLEQLDSNALRTEGVYLLALNRLKKDDSLKNLIKIKSALEKIVDYKDVPSVIEKYTALIDQKVEEERRRKEAEDLARIRKTAKRKRFKKIAIIGGSSTLALSLCLVLLFTLIIPFVKYNKADKLLNEGSFAEAESIYNELETFFETKQRLSVISGMKKIDSGEFEDGIKTILSAGVTVNLSYATNGGTLTDGIIPIPLQQNLQPTNLSSFTQTQTDDSPITYDDYSSFEGLFLPERKGYTFDGWALSGYNYHVDSAFDLTLSAGWTVNVYSLTFDDMKTVKESITVTFNPNYTDAKNTTVQLENGHFLHFPTIPTRNGYAFAGWYTNKSCTSKYSFSGTILQDLTLYAKWVKHSKSEVIHPNAKKSVYISDSITYFAFVPLVSEQIKVYTSGNIDTYGYLYNSSLIQLNLDDDAGDDYNFSYTYNVTAGTLYYVGVRAYSSSGVINLHVDATIPNSTAKAECSDEIAECVYDASSYTTQRITYDSEFSLPAITRTGYTFDGWYYRDAKVENGVWNYNHNVILVPKWKENSFTITFDANGGEVDIPSRDVYYDKSFSLPTPQKTGYTFIGWYDGDEKIKNGIWKIAKNVTLVAKWEANSYELTFQNVKKEVETVTVTYDYNYQGSTPVTKSFKNNETIEYLIPTRSGHVFTGWYTNSECSTPYSFSENVTQDFTLYAKWMSTSAAFVINVGDTKNVYLNGSTIYYYAIVPLVSGQITVYSTGSIDTYGYLYNSNLSTLTYNDDSGSGTNFSYTYNVTAGSLYYIGIKGRSSSTSGNVSLCVTGAKPSNTAKASCSTEVLGYFYNTSQSERITVVYDTNFTLITPEREGYTFLGWYIGDDLVKSGIWNIADDVTLTAMWEQN